MLSRLFGLIRQRVFGHFLGVSPAADAFMAAMRIPNLLQNLFGEGVLSASFIPVYARLLTRDSEEEARKVAGAIAGLLGLVIGLLVVAGLLAAPVLVDVIAPEAMILIWWAPRRRPLASTLRSMCRMMPTERRRLPS